MNNPYDIHAWSKQYREDVLREVQTHRRAQRAREDRGAAGTRVRLAWQRLASLVLAALAEYDTVANRRP